MNSLLNLFLSGNFCPVWSYLSVWGLKLISDTYNISNAESWWIMNNNQNQHLIYFMVFFQILIYSLNIALKTKYHSFHFTVGKDIGANSYMYWCIFGQLLSRCPMPVNWVLSGLRMIRCLFVFCNVCLLERKVLKRQLWNLNKISQIL